MILLPFHIAAGLIAIASGFVALYALKGAKVHRKSGMVFVYAMIALSLTGTTIAAIRSQPPNIMGGMTAFYLVITGALTFRERNAWSQWVDAGSVLFAVALAFAGTALGLVTLHSATGTINGVPPAPMFMFGMVGALAALGDTRVMTRGIRGKQRVARHLWRMCFAMFIATSSFFLGQAKVFPKPVRIMPVLATPVLIVVVLMLYWFIRVNFFSFRAKPASAGIAVN